MTIAQANERVPERWTVGAYFDLVSAGVLGPEDRVELLEGVIVAMSPQNPRHAGAVTFVDYAVRAAVGAEAVIRVQLPLVLAPASVPEPDIAVVPGSLRDYAEQHPTRALLVVEVADSSLLQDRLTKAAIYAAASVPEYWIVNLIDDRVEIHRSPDREARLYRSVSSAGRSASITIAALPSARVAVDDLIPARS